MLTWTKNVFGFFGGVGGLSFFAVLRFLFCFLFRHSYSEFSEGFVVSHFLLKTEAFRRSGVVAQDDSAPGRAGSSRRTRVRGVPSAFGRVRPAPLAQRGELVLRV